MKKILIATAATIAAGLTLGAGCPLPQQMTMVELVNNATLSVDARLFYGDDQLATASTLRVFGDEENFTIPAGGTRQFMVPCDDLQAIFIDEASLALPGGLGPELDTDVLRDGSDFDCGDTIVYTFTGSLIIDFEVDEDVR